MRVVRVMVLTDPYVWRLLSPNVVVWMWGRGGRVAAGELASFGWMVLLLGARCLPFGGCWFSDFELEFAFAFVGFMERLGPEFCSMSFLTVRIDVTAGLSVIIRSAITCINHESGPAKFVVIHGFCEGPPVFRVDGVNVDVEFVSSAMANDPTNERSGQYYPRERHSP